MMATTSVGAVPLTVTVTTKGVCGGAVVWKSVPPPDSQNSPAQLSSTVFVVVVVYVLIADTAIVPGGAPATPVARMYDTPDS